MEIEENRLKKLSPDTGFYPQVENPVEGASPPDARSETNQRGKFGGLEELSTYPQALRLQLFNISLLK
jgi:hypothetical protein